LVVTTEALAARRKGLGAFYTPPALVQSLTAWAIRRGTDRVLEPAAGEAAFLVESLARLRSLGARAPASQVVGVELERRAVVAAEAELRRLGESCTLIRSDFFDVKASALGPPFDVAIGNPPYVRYHLFTGAARARGRRAAESGGVTLTGLASSWAHFVPSVARFLTPEGRLAFVLPAELLHVDYAAPIRAFLLERFASVTVVTFEEAVFPGAMVDAVLLLADGSGPRRGLNVARLRSINEVAQLPVGVFNSAPSLRWSAHRTPIDGSVVLERLRSDGKLARLGACRVR